MKQFQFYLTTMIRPFFIGLLALAAIVFILGFKLGSLTPGFSQNEINQRVKTSNIDVIAENPVYAPHSIGQFALQSLGKTSPLAMRTISAAFAVLSIFAFYLLVRTWHTNRIAAFTTVLYASSAWFLHTARVATPEILFTLFPILFLLWAWLLKQERRGLSFLLAAIACAFIVYIPGMVWFLLIGLVWQAKRIARELRNVSSWYVVLCWFVGIALISPLAYAAYQNPNVLRTIAGLPSEMPRIIDFGKNLVSTLSAFIYKGPNDPGMWLGRLPLLDVFTAAMAIVGIYAYRYRLKLDRTILTTGALILSVVLVALHGPVSIAILLPLMYLFAASGIAFMLQQWFTVFPRNPVAHYIGAGLMAVAIFATVFYHVNHYFIAWPNTPETRTTYNQQP
ncbi:MAG: conserved rane protein of unknown function [Candidatus Saccharibacteria bacterium]|nr:conserved rane protein of unknown function [Candidatus Saccharibacteria bacterium]